MLVRRLTISAFLSFYFCINVIVVLVIPYLALLIVSLSLPLSIRVYMRLVNSTMTIINLFLQASLIKRVLLPFTLSFLIFGHKVLSYLLCGVQLKRHNYTTNIHNIILEACVAMHYAWSQQNMLVIMFDQLAGLLKVIIIFFCHSLCNILSP